MRLGSYECVIRAGSLAEKVYGSKKALERHRHRFEFNLKYREEMEKS